MAYYPKSQIKTNLYTSGNDFVLSTTNQEYIGDYYELSNGEKYTGKIPDDKGGILLILPPNLLITPSPNDNNETIEVKSDKFFNKIQPASFSPGYNFNITNRDLPTPNLTIPTQKDYNLGEFQRYFAKKNNQNIYLEINKETCDQLKNGNPKIAFDLYTAISLSWDLRGEQDQTYLINKNTVTLVENREKWYGFTQWFKDNFLKYYQDPEIQTDLFTDGTEFINRRTKLAYRGPYHIHPEKGPMVGAKHIQRKHDYLDPIQPTPNLIVDPTPTPTPTYSGGGSSTSSGGGGYSGGGGGY